MKQIRRNILWLLFAGMMIVAGSGCYSLTTGLMGMDPNMTASLNDRDLCIAYEGAIRHGFITQHIVGEINRRGLLNTDEWIFVRRSNIYKGMRLCGVYAAWGAPDDQIQVSDPVKGNADRLQLMYRKWARTWKTIVTVENDLVLDWTNP